MSNIKSLGHVPHTDIPILETEHLILRAHQIDDLAPLSDIWADPRTTRFIGNQTRARQDIWKQLLRTMGSWSLLGFGYWIIVHKATSAVIGEAGFMEGLRDITPPFTGAPEAGWVISPKHWGKGYAGQALTAMHAWSDANLPGKHTVCIIEPDHAASIHLAQKAGYRLRNQAHINQSPINVYERHGQA